MAYYEYIFNVFLSWQTTILSFDLKVIFSVAKIIQIALIVYHLLGKTSWWAVNVVVLKWDASNPK